MIYEEMGNKTYFIGWIYISTLQVYTHLTV